MNLVHTLVVHEGASDRTMDFKGGNGEPVAVKVTDDAVSKKDGIIERARQVMIELTAFCSRGGEMSADRSTTS